MFKFRYSAKEFVKISGEEFLKFILKGDTKFSNLILPFNCDLTLCEAYEESIEFMARLRKENLDYMLDLRHSSINGLIAPRFFLEEAKLDNSGLNEVYLVGANLRGTDLRGARMNGSNLTRCSFVNSNCSFSRMNTSLLYKADLEYADFTKVDLENASLIGAKNLDRTRYLNCANLKNCEISQKQYNILKERISEQMLSKTRVLN